MPKNKENHFEYQAKKAEAKLLGTRFCFACQKSRPLATGKYFIKHSGRGINKVWKCAECAAKLKAMGFKNATKNTQARPQQNY